MSCGRNSKVFPLLLICLLASMTAWSQVSTSRIEGTLVDASNAIVPNVTVKVTNENTGITYAVKTSSSGSYSIPSLSPGPYTISVSQTGFETFTSQHNILSVGAPLVANITLKIGATQEVVEVQGAYERIETTNAAVSDVMTPLQIDRKSTR